MSFIENTAPDLYLLRIVYHHLSKLWRSGQKWGWPIQKSINFLVYMKSTYIPKCINVYSIYRTKLGVIGFFVLSFLICFQTYETLLYFLSYFTCMRGDTEKNQKNFSIEPISANPKDCFVQCSIQTMYRTNFGVIG